MESSPSRASISDSEYEPISYTAAKILQKRANHTSIPYAKEMADALGVQWRVSKLRAWARNALWGEVRAGAFLQYRYDAISSALAYYPGSAVLEIAAGFSTRGLSESLRREAYVESDLPGVIRQKPRLVEAVCGAAPHANHHFCSLNACSRPDMERVGELIEGLKLSRPLVIVHEGILMYLDSGEQRSFRDNIRWLLAEYSPRGAWITTDFSERDLDETVWQRLMTSVLTRRVARRFNRFPDDSSVKQFLSAADLSFEKLPSLKTEDRNPEVRAVAETLRAWRISLR